MAPLAESEYCWAHDPANVEAAAEARKMGGLRRRREGTFAGAFDYAGITSVPDIRRVLDIAILDAFALDNSIARCRTLGYLASQATKLLEVGELEDRIAALEAAKHQHDQSHQSLFDLDTEDPFALPGDML